MKIYKNLSDKFGDKYSFDNYSDFAEFWLNLSYVTQCELFGPLMTNKLNCIGSLYVLLVSLVFRLDEESLQIFESVHTHYTHFTIFMN